MTSAAASAAAAVPAEPEFVLTEVTAPTVLARIHALVDHPRHFVLLNRIDRALSNLKNIGQVNDVSAILRAQAENDEDQVASSYTLLNGLVWAIPVLGFIGTVQGLSMAIGQFTVTLQSAGDLSAIRNENALHQRRYSGMLPCFLGGFLSRLVARVARPLINFARV